MDLQIFLEMRRITTKKRWKIQILMKTPELSISFTES